MTASRDDAPAPGAGPNEGRDASLPPNIHFPAIAQLIVADTKLLLTQAHYAAGELDALATVREDDSAAAVLHVEAALTRSPDDVVALLHSLGGTTSRLARRVRPLFALRHAHLASRAVPEDARARHDG